jgi:hypothetical protein
VVVYIRLHKALKSTSGAITFRAGAGQLILLSTNVLLTIISSALKCPSEGCPYATGQMSNFEAHVCGQYVSNTHAHR